MATDKYKLCSMALTLIGAAPITSFEEETDVSRACAEIYDDFAKYILTLHTWRFNSKKQQLTRLNSTPVNVWLYAFQKPADEIRIHAVYESGQDGAQPIQDFDIFGDEIYTNFTTLYADYQYYPAEVYWPSYFVEFAKNALAAQLAPIITDDYKRADFYGTLAFGLPADNRTGGLLGEAKRIDSMQRPMEPIVYNELLAARMS